jgi:hypothetical protein
LRVISIAQVIAGAVQQFGQRRSANRIENTAKVASTREDET